MENIKLLTSKDIHLQVLQNSVHLFTICCFGLICSLCLIVEYFSLYAIGGTVIIMLFYYLVKLIKNIWFWLILIVSLIFPVAAPFIMIFMVCWRMKFLFNHRSAMAYGVIIYLVPVMINFSFKDIGNTTLNPYIFGFVFISSATLMHFLLVSLYKKGYVLRNAIILMLEFPVLMILLVVSISGIFDGHLFDKPVNDGHFSDLHQVDGHYYDGPGVHEVSGYFRHGANGDLQFVSAHLRTNPDGILENNFSYKA